MKQLLFMFGTLGFGLFAGFIEPLMALVPYYVFAIVQPQALWEWALPSDVRWSLAAGAMGLLFVVLHAPSLIGRIRFNGVIVLMMVYTLLLALSCLTAYNTSVAQHWFGTIFKTLLVAGVVGLMINRFQHIVTLCLVIFGSTGLVAWHFNSLYLFDGRLDIFAHGLGALDNNGISLMLLMGLPMAYALMVTPRPPGGMWMRIAAAFVGLFILHAVMLSYSRGAMLAGCVGLAWLLWRHRPRWQVVFAVPLLVVAIGVMAGQEIRDEFRSISTYEEDHSALSRLDSWDAAWRMAWDHPLTGVGIRNANLYSYNYGADRVGRTIHNQYLQVGADAGLPALGVYLAMIGMSFAGTWHARRQLYAAIDERAACDEHDPAEVDRLRLYGHLCTGIEAAIIIFVVGAMFLSLETFEVSLLLMAMAGALPHVTRTLLTPDAAATEAAAIDAAAPQPMPEAVAPQPMPGAVAPQS